MQDYFYKNQNLYFKLDNQLETNTPQQDNSFLFFKIWRNLVIRKIIISSIYLINHNNLCPTTQTFGYARVYEDINSINWMLSYGHIGLLVDKVRRNDRNLIFCIKSLEKIISTINYSNKQQYQQSFIINSELEIEKFYISLIRHYRDYLVNYSDHLLPFSVKHNNIISFKLICSLMTTQYSNNNINNNNNNKNHNKIKQHVTTSPLITSSEPRPISNNFDIYITQNVIDLIYSIGSIQLLDYIKKVKPLVYDKIDHKNSFFQTINNMDNAEIGNRIGNYYLYSNKIQLLNFDEINNTLSNSISFNNNSNDNNNNNNNNNNKNIFSNIFKIISNNTTNNCNNTITQTLPHISLNKLIQLDTNTIQQLSINIPSMFNNYQISEFSQLLNKLSKSELTNTIFKASKKQKLFILNFILIFEYTKMNQNNEIIKLIQLQQHHQYINNGADGNEIMDNESIKKIIHYFVFEIIMKYIQFNNGIKFSIILEYLVQFNNSNIQVNEYIHMNSSCYITIFQIALEYADITLFKYLVKMKETDQDLVEYQELINNKECEFEIFRCIKKNGQGIEKIKQFLSFILETKPTILLDNSWFIKSLISVTGMCINDHLQMIRNFIESIKYIGASKYLQKDIIIQVIKTCNKLGNSSYGLLDYFIGLFNELDEKELSIREEWYSHSFIRMAIKLKDLNLLHKLFKYNPFSKFGEIGSIQNTKKLIKCAVINQNYEIVSYLLELGFKFGSRCYSISYRKGNFKILELLFKNSKSQLYGIGKDADLLKLASDNINLMKFIQKYHQIDYNSLKYGPCPLTTTTTTTSTNQFKSKEFILLNQISPNYKTNDISIVIPKNQVIQLLLNELSAVVSDQLYLHYIQIRSIFETLIVNGNLDCIMVWMKHPLMVQKFKNIFKDDIQILIEKTIQYGFIDILRYLIFDQQLSLPSQVLNVIVIPNLVKQGSISTLDFLFKFSILNSSNNGSGGSGSGEEKCGEIIKFQKSHVVIACKSRQIHMIRYIHKRAPCLFNDPKQYIISDNLESGNNCNINSGSSGGNNLNGSGGNNNIGRIIRSSVSHCNFFNFNDNEITTTHPQHQQPINIINTINNTISNLTGSSSIYNLNSQELNSVIDDINHYFLSLI